jgi:hypothetical protein
MKCRVETIEMGVVPFASCAHRARLSRRSIVILIDRSLLPPNVSVSESVLSSFTTSATSSPALSTLTAEVLLVHGPPRHHRPRGGALAIR